MAGRLSFKFESLSVSEADVWRKTPPPALHGIPSQLTAICRQKLGSRAVLHVGERVQEVEIDDLRNDRVERRLLLKTALGHLGIPLQDGRPVMYATTRFAAQFKGTTPDDTDPETATSARSITDVAEETVDRFSDKLDLLFLVVEMQDLESINLLTIQRGLEPLTAADANVPTAIKHALGAFAVFATALAKTLAGVFAGDKQNSAAVNAAISHLMSRPAMSSTQDEEDGIIQEVSADTSLVKLLLARVCHDDPAAGNAVHVEQLKHRSTAIHAFDLIAEKTPWVLNTALSTVLLSELVISLGGAPTSSGYLDALHGELAFFATRVHL
mgnify:CR=1 FL=1|jgi:hypothetical protein